MFKIRIKINSGVDKRVLRRLEKNRTGEWKKEPKEIERREKAEKRAEKRRKRIETKKRQKGIVPRSEWEQIKKRLENKERTLNNEQHKQ